MIELIRGIHNIKEQHKGCVLTIGNFDGIHLGHQHLLNHLKIAAKKYSLPSLVITFEPQPGEYFHHGDVPPRIMRLRGKLRDLESEGIDRLLAIRFCEKTAKISADDFLKKILIEKLGAKHIAIGDDFRFGAKRAGDFDLLQKHALEYGYTTEQMDTFKLNNKRVSSTLVREELQKGDLKAAEILLGRRYMMSGRVAHGDKLGRTIGFPTANIHLHRKAVPIDGIFAVRVYGIEDKPLNGVANVGNRPTIDGSGRSLLEVHLFNFHQNIYGKNIVVEFCKRFRSEEKYDSMEKLKEQIFTDALMAKEYFSQ